VRSVIVRVIVIIVPFFALFLPFTLLILALVFNPPACISTTDDVTQVATVFVVSLVVLLWWSDVVGRVPTWTLSVVIIITLVSVLLVTDSIRYCRCIQHLLESLDKRVDLFVIFGEMGVI
jgi:hypothetical protein